MYSDLFKIEHFTSSHWRDSEQGDIDHTLQEERSLLSGPQIIL